MQKGIFRYPIVDLDMALRYSKECADKEIEHACQAKKQSQLEAEVSKHCKPKDQSTGEDYRKCRAAKKELKQREADEPIQQARDEADRECGRS